MALRGKSSQPTVTFAMKCEYYLRRAGEQKALASQMFQKARQMCKNAEEMRLPQNPRHRGG